MTGPLLTQGEREIRFQQYAIDDLRRQSRTSELARGDCLCDIMPLPEDLASVVRTWQRLAWYTVEGCQDYFVHNMNFKPGDLAANVLFAFAFHCFHTELLEALRVADLIETVPRRGLGIYGNEQPALLAPLGAPHYTDDMCIPRSDACPIS